MEKRRKVVVITGASSGIGLETARILAKKGYIVYGLAHREYVTEEFNFKVCDVTNYAQFAETIKEIHDKEGQIDVLVNNAGMGISGAVEYLSMENNEKLFNLNMMAVLNDCREIIPYFRKQGYGKIVNTSSLAGIIPLPFQTAYSMSKAAINSLTMSLSLELKPMKIKVCGVMPGDTKTGFTSARVKENASEGYNERIKKSVSKMEKDETTGLTPTKVANVIVRQIERKNPPVLVSTGFSAKMVSFLEKILPRRFMLWVVGKIYASN